MSKPLLVGHPPWRQMLIVSTALPTVIVAAVLAFAWPASRIQPRDLPVGIVGSTSESRTVIEHLETARPGGFDFHRYADPAHAREAITNRQVYGAFARTPGHLVVFDARAASTAVAQLLTTVGTNLVDAANFQAAAHGQAPVQLMVRDVVPLSAADPNGLVFSATLLPLTICSVIIAAAVGLLIKFRPAWRQLVALTVVSAVAGAGAYLISQAFLGALPEHAAADWASLTLTILAMSASTAGLIALIGAAGLGISAVLMVFIGNPFSGANSAPQLLPVPVNHIGQSLPPGAGANLLRSAAYFNGSAATGHLAVLLAWIALGFAGIILGHHSSIRFAAHPSHGLAPLGTEPAETAHAKPSETLRAAGR
jgi:hypothetical protein